MGKKDGQTNVERKVHVAGWANGVSEGENDGDEDAGEDHFHQHSEPRFEAFS